MQLVFRKLLPGEKASPLAGELYVHSDNGRRDLSCLALDRGLAVFPQGAGTTERVVVNADPTLDDLLAATFVMRLLAGTNLPEGCRAFARYAALAREGIRPGSVPLEGSLEGIYLAVRAAAGDDLTAPESAERFAADWARIASRIWEAVGAGTDPFATSLFASDSAFARERAYLAADHEVFRQDVLRGERWLVRLPGGPPQGTALLLDRPKSLLFKYWCRQQPGDASGGPGLLLIVDWGQGQWVFSTDPLHRLSLQPLAELLQKAESKADATRAAADPWFDGKPFGHTLVASPKRGTVLPREKVLRIVQKWSQARRRGRIGWMAAVASAAAVLLIGFAAVLAFSRDLRPGTSGGERGMVRVTEDQPVSRRGILSVLSIGVSKYQDPRYNLSYADADAKELAEVLKKQTAGPFEKVECHEPLLNEKATKEAILEVLDRLGQNHNQYDMVIVTVAGHGAKNRNNDFYFLPHDFNREKAASTGVYWDDFKRSLGRMPCPVWVVMDTCHSGAVTQEGFRGQDDLEESIKRGVNSFGNTGGGMVVTAACLSGESAREKPEWGHGALSLAILEGLTGRQWQPGSTATYLPAPAALSGAICLEDLNHYVSKRVQEFAEGKQAVVTNQTGNIALNRLFIYHRSQ